MTCVGLYYVTVSIPSYFQLLWGKIFNIKWASMRENLSPQSYLSECSESGQIYTCSYLKSPIYGCEIFLKAKIIDIDFTLIKVLFCIKIITSLQNNLSPSYTVTIQAPIHHDSSQFETDGKIGLHRDASGWKKRNSSINTMSQDAPTVSARFIYGPTTTHDDSATIHHGGATNAHECS